MYTNLALMIKLSSILHMDIRNKNILIRLNNEIYRLLPCMNVHSYSVTITKTTAPKERRSIYIDIIFCF